MDRKLTNNSFELLRNWLFPGTSGDNHAPDVVADQVLTVVDSEHWVQVPRFTATCLSPAVAARQSAINFENFRTFPLLTGSAGTMALTNQRPLFTVTDLFVRQRFFDLTLALFAIHSTWATSNDRANYTQIFNQSVANVNTQNMSGGDSRNVTLFHGDAVAGPGVATVQTLSTLADAGLWIPLPDLEPGNGIQFFALGLPGAGAPTNLAFQLDFMWAERRAPGAS